MPPLRFRRRPRAPDNELSVMGRRRRHRHGSAAIRARAEARAKEQGVASAASARRRSVGAATRGEIELSTRARSPSATCRLRAGNRAHRVVRLSGQEAQRQLLDQLRAIVDPGRPVAFFCRSGVRSKHAAMLAAASGLRRGIRRFGGFEGDKNAAGQRVINGWRVAGLPWRQDERATDDRNGWSRRPASIHGQPWRPFCSRASAATPGRCGLPDPVHRRHLVDDIQAASARGAPAAWSVGKPIAARSARADRARRPARQRVGRNRHVLSGADPGLRPVALCRPAGISRGPSTPPFCCSICSAICDQWAGALPVLRRCSCRPSCRLSPPPTVRRRIPWQTSLQ